MATRKDTITHSYLSVTKRRQYFENVLVYEYWQSNVVSITLIESLEWPMLLHSHEVVRGPSVFVKIENSRFVVTNLQNCMTIMQDLLNSGTKSS